MKLTEFLSGAKVVFLSTGRSDQKGDNKLYRHLFCHSIYVLFLPLLHSPRVYRYSLEIQFLE